MYSTDTINEIVREATENARENNLTPTHIKDVDLTTGRFPFPFLGDYIPEGWEVARDIDGDPVTFLCDSSGLGVEDEPALTVKQLTAKLRDYKRSGDSYGFAVIESGQCQVVVGVFKTHSRDFTHSGKLTKSELAKVL